ncbi:MAG TPA: SDR family NAD(P)-dependent oxidoreductase, partial [Steroidobacteraceae bacterium]|nr:SDR family NAD(P)-dependent oxidoreductase [Steroidobacteraceae bacterium]
MGEFVKGKVIVVTGSGGGIGRDMARVMAAHGARVVVNDLGRVAGTEQSAAEQVAQEIRSAGGQAVASTDSVASPESAAHIVQAALDSFGRIDAIVNNAGIVRDRMFFNMSADEWKDVLDVHLNGSFYVSRAAAPHFKAQNS